MSFALTSGMGWNKGYLIVAIIQIALSAVIFMSLPLWKKRKGGAGEEATGKLKPLTPVEIIKTKGAVTCFICFFSYCALEQTAMLWASSYMVFLNGITAEDAAKFASLFFIGITAGRAINGFLTVKFSDKTLIRAGLIIITVGIALIVAPSVQGLTVAGFIVMGLGCAPVYPCIIHMTPQLFGEDKSQAMIGVQMASAYLGSCFMPSVYGALANGVTPALLPAFLAFFLVVMAVMHEITQRACKVKPNNPAPESI